MRPWQGWGRWRDGSMDQCIDGSCNRMYREAATALVALRMEALSMACQSIDRCTCLRACCVHCDLHTCIGGVARHTAAGARRAQRSHHRHHRSALHGLGGGQATPTPWPSPSPSPLPRLRPLPRPHLPLTHAATFTSTFTPTPTPTLTSTLTMGSALLSGDSIADLAAPLQDQAPPRRSCPPRPLS